MRLAALALVVALALVAGCTSETALGGCVGLIGDRDPHLTYKVDTTNVVVGIIFIETIFVPVIVALDELYCPVGRKAVTP